LVRFKKKGKYGIMDQKGKEVVKAEFATPELAWREVAIRNYILKK
jgi:hypothetical protein